MRAISFVVAALAAANVSADDANKLEDNAYIYVPDYQMQQGGYMGVGQPMYGAPVAAAPVAPGPTMAAGMTGLTGLGGM